MYGVALALLKSEVLPALAGRLVFIGVPAEEYIEIEYRDELRRAGKIAYLGGKPEFIRLGEMDDVDIAMMTHLSPAAETKSLATVETMNGLVAKRIQYVGRTAHAGGVPHMGINALNAATIALQAIHAQRETFRDQDTIRVHPIITKGGDVVNAIPADVRMETFVRGKTADAIMDANAKVDRGSEGRSAGYGCTGHDHHTAGGTCPWFHIRSYGPCIGPTPLAVVGEEQLGCLGHLTGSTDMGDVSQIMPVIHPFSGGVSGTSHGTDYLIEDYEKAVVNPAKGSGHDRDRSPCRRRGKGKRNPRQKQTAHEETAVPGLFRQLDQGRGISGMTHNACGFICKAVHCEPYSVLHSCR